MKPLIYIAGPITNPPGEHVENAKRASVVGEQVFETGMAIPYMPHILLWWSADLMEKDDRWISPTLGRYTYEEWMDMCFNVIPRCDALFRMNGYSPGADREVEFARNIGIPVFHSMSGLESWLLRYTGNW